MRDSASHNEDPDKRFTFAAAMYATVVLFAVVGFVAGWTLRGEQEEVLLHRCNLATEAVQTESRSCSATLEQAFKQSRELGANLSKCRERLSAVYTSEMYGK